MILFLVVAASAFVSGRMSRELAVRDGMEKIQLTVERTAHEVKQSFFVRVESGNAALNAAMSSGFGSINERIESAAAAAEEQTASVGEISAIMENLERQASSVKDMASELAAETEIISRAGDDLSAAAKDMKTSVKDIRTELQQNTY